MITNGIEAQEKNALNEDYSDVILSKQDDASLGGGKTVLIVDDEPIILKATTAILQNAGLVVYTCELWGRISALIRRVQPDLILLDYNMPSLKGDNLCSILKQNQNTKDTKVVMFSAEDEDFLDEVSRECGADGYIQKGLPKNQFIDCVTHYLTLDSKTLSKNTVHEKKPGLKTVLLVDDSPIPRKICGQIITKQYGSSILEAKNGHEAIQLLFDNSDVDMILLDINMPIMNGIQFLEKFKNNGKFGNIPTIIASTEGNESDILRAMGLGANAYIKKPFTSNALTAVIDNVLKKERGSIK